LKNIFNQDIAFSIIVPTYNRASKIKRLLDCLKTQIYKNFEVIICDDGSSDNTREVVKSFSDLLEIVYIYNPNWGGPAKPRNIGINNSKFDWICFLDSDDIWLDTKLYYCYLEICQNSNVDFIYHNMNVISNEIKTKKIIGKYIPDNRMNKNFLNLIYNGNKIALSTAVIKKKFLITANFFTEEKRFIGIEDFDLYLKLALMNINFKYINKTLGYYYISNDNISNDELKQAEKIDLLNREYHSKIRLLDTNKLNSIVYYKKAIYYKRVKNYKISNHLFFKTILNSKNINLILKSFYNILF